MSKAKVEELHRFRFDYVKFQFPDLGAYWSVKARKQIESALLELQAEYPHNTLAEPKFTPLQPRLERPNGLLLVELWGRAAEVVHRLPWQWVEYVTFAHVKSYADLPENGTYKQLLDLFDQPGYRKSARTTPPKRKNSVKHSGLPGLQIGSKKSDLHFTIYARPGERIGVEGKFRDERLYNLRDTACVSYDPASTRSKEGWRVLLALCARQTLDQLDYEFLSREAELGEYLLDLSRVHISPRSARGEYTREGQLSLESARGGAEALDSFNSLPEDEE